MEWPKACFHRSLVTVFCSAEGTTLSEPRRLSKLGTPADVSETNVAHPWDAKVVDKRTPKGWP